MSGRAKPPGPRSQPPPTTAPSAEGIVQQLLAERRELLIANERLRLELEDLRGRPGRVDPRLSMLERDNRALREELAEARRQLDRQEQALGRLVDTIADEIS